MRIEDRCGPPPRKGGSASLQGQERMLEIKRPDPALPPPSGSYERSMCVYACLVF